MNNGVITKYLSDNIMKNTLFPAIIEIAHFGRVIDNKTISTRAFLDQNANRLQNNRYVNSFSCDIDDLDYIIWGELFLRNIDYEVESYIESGNILRVNYIGFDMDMHTSLSRLADWVYTKEIFLADIEYLSTENDWLRLPDLKLDN